MNIAGKMTSHFIKQSQCSNLASFQNVLSWRKQSQLSKLLAHPKKTNTWYILLFCLFRGIILELSKFLLLNIKKM